MIWPDWQRPAVGYHVDRIEIAARLGMVGGMAILAVSIISGFVVVLFKLGALLL